jgi:hypothetical protein
MLSRSRGLISCFFTTAGSVSVGEGSSILPAGGSLGIGRSKRSIPNRAVMTARSITFWSSRMLPSHGDSEMAGKWSFRRADFVRPAPDGERHTGGRHLPRAWHQRGDLLHLEEEILRLGLERIARAAAAARRERQAQAPGRRPIIGSAHLAGDRAKKPLKPRQRRELVHWTQNGLCTQLAAGGGADGARSVDLVLQEPRWKNVTRSTRSAFRRTTICSGTPGSCSRGQWNGQATSRCFDSKVFSIRRRVGR